MVKTYENLKAEVQKLQSEGALARTPSAAERADWAYGNTKVENDEVTRDMANRAVENKDTSD